MRILDVIHTLNAMRQAAVIDRYAIGGAVGATFFLEPVSTLDVDVFVELHAQGSSLIINLDPIVTYLRAQGVTMEGEYFMIGGWPVQFLPPTSPLAEEAIVNAVELDVDGTPVSVFTAEHLAAIALQTGRAKDKARLLQFIEADAIHMETFQAILQAHHLMDAWTRFERQFLE